jgi:PAS domain-containing protein
MTIRKQSRIRQGQADSERRIRELQDRGGAFVEAVEATRMPMLVTGPQAVDNRIIYANPAYLDLCGPPCAEWLGGARNPRLVALHICRSGRHFSFGARLCTSIFRLCATLRYSGSMDLMKRERWRISTERLASPCFLQGTRREPCHNLFSVCWYFHRPSLPAQQDTAREGADSRDRRDAQCVPER